MDKQGRVRDYESVYLRRTFRDGGRVRNETVANLSTLPVAAISAIEATLKGQTLIPAASEFTITRSLRHGHVAAVAAMGHRLGFPGLFYIPPGTPWHNACVESLHNRLRKECLNRNHWTNLREARVVIGELKREHNHRHRHSALGYLTPAEYAAAWKHTHHPITCDIN